MLPEEAKALALRAIDNNRLEEAHLYATLGVLEAILQMQICAHGTRGFCKDCFRLELIQNQPFNVR